MLSWQIAVGLCCLTAVGTLAGEISTENAGSEREGSDYAG